MAIRISFDSCMTGTETDINNGHNSFIVTEALQLAFEKYRKAAVTARHPANARSYAAQARRILEICESAYWERFPI